MRPSSVLGFALLFVGCVPPPVYKVQRTARVPRPAVPLRTGEPLAGPVEFSFGANSVGDVRDPELADAEASVEVPSQQLRGEVRIRLGTRGEVAGIYEQAIESSLQPLDATQAEVRDGVPQGYGMAMRYSIDTGSPGLSVGLGVEAIQFKIPYVEYRTCIEWCEENGVSGTQMHRGTESTGTFALALTPTYRTGNLALFAGAYTRRHPTIKRKGTELYAMEVDQDVDGGMHNWLVHAGVEYRVQRVVSVLATVQQNLTRDPVQYGPSVGLSLALTVPDAPRRPNSLARPVEPPPAPAPAPPLAHDYDAELPDDPW